MKEIPLRRKKKKYKINPNFSCIQMKFIRVITTAHNYHMT